MKCTGLGFGVYGLGFGLRCCPGTDCFRKGGPQGQVGRVRKASRLRKKQHLDELIMKAQNSNSP